MSTVLDVYAAGLRGGGSTPLCARLGDDRPTFQLPVERWLGPADGVDEDVLSRARGPVLDLGCGPGRHLAALRSQGMVALGVDISPVAVALARRQGARAVCASVFDPLPDTGGWRTALLLDGNVGIGGGPTRLLGRVAELLRADGELLIELGDPATATESLDARLESGELASDWFPWSRVSVNAIEPVAAEAGFVVTERWRSSGRWFARLTRAGAATRTP